MASKKLFVILLLALVAFACAENSNATASDSTGNNPSPPAAAPPAAAPPASAPPAFVPPASVPPAAAPPAAAPPASAPNAATNACVLMFKLDMTFGNTAYNIFSDDVDKTKSCINRLATIRWGKTLNSSISFNYFTSDPQAKDFTIDNITLTIGVADNYVNPKAGEPVDLRLDEKITAQFGSSYRCSSLNYTLIGLPNGTQYTFTITNVQFEVFRNSNSVLPFSSRIIYCDKDVKDKAAKDKAASDKTTSDKTTSDKTTSDKAVTDKATSDKAKETDGLSVTAITVISVACILLASIASIALIVYLRKRKNLCIFGASARHVAE